LTLALEETVMN